METTGKQGEQVYLEKAFFLVKTTRAKLAIPAKPPALERHYVAGSRSRGHADEHFSFEQRRFRTTGSQRAEPEFRRPGSDQCAAPAGLVDFPPQALNSLLSWQKGIQAIAT